MFKNLKSHTGVLNVSSKMYRGGEYSKDEVIYTCSKCDGLLDVIYDYSQLN